MLSRPKLLRMAYWRNVCVPSEIMALLDWPSQHIQRPGRVSLSCEKLPSAPQCCPASGSGASSAPEASSPWPPHFLWKRLGWYYHPSFPVAPPPFSPSFPHSPSLSLNFLMATSSLVSCKDTGCMMSAKWEMRKGRRKVSQKPTGNIKKLKMVCRSCRKNRQNNARLSFYLCTVLACKRPTASLAQFMCNPPAFSLLIDLAEKMRLLQKHCCDSE